MDLRAALRRRVPDRHRTRLTPQGLADWSDLAGEAPAALVLDTGVYIHSAAGRLPAGLQSFLARSLLFHCAVALAELSVGIAAADPRLGDWSALRDHYAELFAQVPASRLLAPDPLVFAEAGLVAGTLARLQGYQPHQRAACRNDALLHLCAAKAGLPLLTANVTDFDLIGQLVPEGRVITYRPD